MKLGRSSAAPKLSFLESDEGESEFEVDADDDISEVDIDDDCVVVGVVPPGLLRFEYLIPTPKCSSSLSTPPTQGAFTTTSLQYEIRNKNNQTYFHCIHTGKS
jgi:hypothetical protein